MAPAHGEHVVRSRTSEHVTVERRAFGTALRVACTCLPTRGGWTTLVVRVQATPRRGPRALTRRLAAFQARRELARITARASGSAAPA